MEVKAPAIVRVTRKFDVSPERVFDAWLDVKTARKFFFATPSGEMIRAEVDPRVGGSFNFTDRRESGDAVHVGEYIEIDRPRRLVFKFSVDGSNFDRVSIDIRPDGAGCELTLTHEMRPEWAEYTKRAEGGWTMILDALASSLS
jgi:uncharacterized protein YndB with AHSA1/START domain